MNRLPSILDQQTGVSRTLLSLSSFSPLQHRKESVIIMSSYRKAKITAGGGSSGGNSPQPLRESFNATSSVASSSNDSHGCNGSYSYSSSSSLQQAVLRQRYRIRLCAQNLPTKRLFQAPDTFAVVTSVPKADYDHHDDAAHTRRDEWGDTVTTTTTTTKTMTAAAMIRGRTEVICNNRHPQWTTTILLEEEIMEPGDGAASSFFYVHIFEQSHTLTSFGTVLFHPADILSNPRWTRVKRLRSGGYLYCQLEKVNSSSSSSPDHLAVSLQIAAKDIQVKHSVLELAKYSDDHHAGWLVVHRTPPVLDSVTPTYDTFTLYVRLCFVCVSLCVYDVLRPVSSYRPVV
jgi:hypothetical protein